MGNHLSTAAADNDIDDECRNFLHNLIAIVEMLEVKDAEIDEIKHQNSVLEEKIDEIEGDVYKIAFQYAIQKDTMKEQKHTIDQKDVQINRLNYGISDLRTTLADVKLQMKTQKKKYENIIHQMSEDHEKFVQRSETSRQKMELEIAKLAKENSKLIDPDRMCLIKHVAPHGKVDYYHLNGKILLVKKLVLDGQKFIADGIEVTFDDSEFQIHVSQELAVKHTTFITIPERIKYCNIVKLSLEDLTLTFNEYKDIIESCNIECLSLHRLTVEQYSNVIDVADLLKEVPNIEYFEYTFNKRESIPCHKLAELHPFPRLQRLHVNEIHENFDIKTFAEFIKKNPTVSYELSLRCCPKFFGKVKSVEKDAVPASYKVKIVKLK